MRLYGLHFRIDLGPGKRDLKPLGVICEIDGTGMREASKEEVLVALDEVQGMPFLHPSKKAPAGPQSMGEIAHLG